MQVVRKLKFQTMYMKTTTVSEEWRKQVSYLYLEESLLVVQGITLK